MTCPRRRMGRTCRSWHLSFRVMGRAWDYMAPVGLWAGWLALRKRDFRDAPQVFSGRSRCRALRVPRRWRPADGHELGRPARVIFGFWKTADAVNAGLIVRLPAITLLYCGLAVVVGVVSAARSVQSRGCSVLPANVLAGIILCVTDRYVLFGGADFAGGVWYLLPPGHAGAAARGLSQKPSPRMGSEPCLADLAIVLLSPASPARSRSIAIGLHIPLTLMLIGIVLRGSAFVFQSYGGGGGRVFATASLVTPVFARDVCGGGCFGHGLVGRSRWIIRYGHSLVPGSGLSRARRHSRLGVKTLDAER